MPTPLRESPSSRRAWVEIAKRRTPTHAVTVALLAEGVGRNFPGTESGTQAGVALLAEGVGRNYAFRNRYCQMGGVALLAEGVGRNFMVLSSYTMFAASPSSRRAWVEISTMAV